LVVLPRGSARMLFWRGSREDSAIRYRDRPAEMRGAAGEQTEGKVVFCWRLYSRSRSKVVLKVCMSVLLLSEFSGIELTVFGNCSVEFRTIAGDKVGACSTPNSLKLLSDVNEDSLAI